MVNFSKEESTVLNIVEEFLEKKTFSTLKELVEFVANRVKYHPSLNKRGVERILKSLMTKRIIIPGTKLMKNNIFDNDTRRELFHYITKHPARNVNDIMSDQDLGSNQALWHLSCLEKFQFIRSKKMGNQRIFFEFDSNPEDDQLYYYLGEETVQDMITLMRDESKQFKKTELIDCLDLNYYSVNKYLNALVKLDLVKKIKTNGRSVYELNEKKYASIQDRLSCLFQNSFQ